MPRIKLLWLLFPSYVLITAGALFGLALYSRVSLRDFHLDQISADLESRARLFSSEVRNRLATGDVNGLDKIAKQLGRSSATRITVIAPSGIVLADTERPPNTMENHRQRVEIATAFDERHVGQSLRYSNTMHEHYKYVAIPLIEEGKVIAVVRASKPVTVINAARDALVSQLVAAGGVAAILIVLVSWLIARGISRPVESMTAAAQRYADGELQDRLEPAGTVEFVELAKAMNVMARQLSERIDTLVRERNQRDAILGSMEEGVVALGETGRIIRANRAFGRILGTDPGAAGPTDP